MVEDFKTAFEVQRFLYDQVGFRNCGRPELALDGLRELLQLVLKRQEAQGERDQWAMLTCDIDEKLGGYDNPWYWWVWHWLGHVNLVGHGGSVSGSWLTSEGKRLLRGLEAFSSREILDAR